MLMKKIPFIFLLLLLPALSSYALSDSVKNKLKEVSSIMYRQRNENFVIVDAIIDGLVQLDSAYSCFYDKGDISINDKKLTGALKKKYTDKTRMMYDPNPNKSHSFSMSCSSGVGLNEIFNAASSFRKPLPIFSFEKDDFQPYRPVVIELVKDRLVDTATKYTIRYNINGLFIDDIEVPKNKAERYKRLINTIGFAPKAAGDQLYIDREQTTYSSSNK